ncbi:hypothetical protein ACFP67_14315 [Mammaliicoccus sciuri]|uniref:hypothetical protein n=1 Tax=Mammaliicoccus sciuri TaxID=1296 RepID=UPI000CD26896|nr:hypothetical protein [Mammaliicoccus sciuri]PNZ29961.1 hypothetical protein CD114_01010 [Mammaliicoccus sciuri]
MELTNEQKKSLIGRLVHNVLNDLTSIENITTDEIYYMKKLEDAGYLKLYRATLTNKDFELYMIKFEKGYKFEELYGGKNN